MAHASVGVQRSDGFERYSGAPNLYSRRVEDREKSSENSFIYIEQSGRPFHQSPSHFSENKLERASVEAEQMSWALPLSPRCLRTNGWHFFRVCAYMRKDTKKKELSWSLSDMRHRHQQTINDKSQSWMTSMYKYAL